MQSYEKHKHSAVDKVAVAPRSQTAKSRGSQQKQSLFLVNKPNVFNLETRDSESCEGFIVQRPVLSAKA